MKISKINLLAIVATLISVTTMSFKSINSVVDDPEEYVWYLKGENPGEWILFDNGNPHELPPAPCRETTGDLCAKGYLMDPGQENVEETDGDEERSRPIL